MAILRATPGVGASTGPVVFNVKAIGGAKGDGTTDDTAAINNTIAAMPAIANTFGAASGVLYFPAGRYITQGGHSIPSGKRIQVRGDGPYVSILYKAAGATADLFTVAAQNSGLVDITLDGNRANALGGDLLVLNAAYAYAHRCTIANGYGNGITVGKAAGAILHRLDHVDIRLCRGYGIQVVGGSGSSDGQWTNVDVGQSGLSGVRISSGAQLLTNVHSWGNGIESLTDRAGFWLNSTANRLTGCQAETNLGNGVLISSAGSDGNSITGGSIWGNVISGIYEFLANKTAITGAEIYNNGVTNTAGAASVAFAGIQNESCVESAIAGNNIYDNGVAIAAGSYTTTPTYPYPGRTAQQTQAYAYAEANTGSGVPNFNTLSGNVMRKERTRSGVAYINLGNDNRWDGNVVGAIAVPTLAAAATIFPSPASDFVEVTGSATITSVNPSYPGRRITLRFSAGSPGQVTDGSNLVLAGNFSATTDDTLSLICDGTNWYETGRSTN